MCLYVCVCLCVCLVCGYVYLQGQIERIGILSSVDNKIEYVSERMNSRKKLFIYMSFTNDV